MYYQGGGRWAHKGILRAGTTSHNYSIVRHVRAQVHELWVLVGGLPVVLHPQGGLDSAQFS